MTGLRVTLEMVLDVDDSDALRTSAAQSRYDVETPWQTGGPAFDPVQGPAGVGHVQESDENALGTLLMDDLPWRVGALPGTVLLTAEMRAQDPEHADNEVRFCGRGKGSEERGL